MLKIITLILCLTYTTALFSEEKTYGDVTLSEIVSIYDGDTFTGTIKDWPTIIGYRISIRVAGIDCPEMRDKRPEIKAKAQEAKQYVVNRLREAKEVRLINIRRDKYFRILADISVDGKDLAKELIEKGLAKPYDGGTKEKW